MGLGGVKACLLVEVWGGKGREGVERLGVGVFVGDAVGVSRRDGV